MLTSLREKSQSFLIFVLFGILIIVFIFFFGPQSQGWRSNGSVNDPNATAAKVNGEAIPLREVEVSVRRQALYNSSISESQIAELRRAAAAQVIDQVAVEQNAAKMGVVVSENELTSYIRSEKNGDYPLFLNNKGKFDYDRYQAQVTQQFAASSDQYRRAKEREVVVGHYMDFLVNQAKVSEAEVREAFNNQARTWTFDFVAVEPERDPAPATAEEIADFKAKNADKIAAAYEANKKQYDHGVEVHIRRILVKPPRIESSAGNAKARKQAQALLDRVKGGEDFATVATSDSEDFYASKGGDMGWVTEENSSKEDFAVYSALNVGDISELQENAVGFWFVKAEEVKPALHRSLEEVTPELAAKLAAESRAQAAAKTRAEALLVAAKATDSLEAALANAGETKKIEAVPVVEAAEGAEAAEAAPVAEEPAQSKLFVTSTGAFNIERTPFSRIPLIGENEALSLATLKTTMESPLLPEVYEVEGRYIVARLTELKQPSDEDFAAQKDDIRRALEANRAREFFGLDWRSALFDAPQRLGLIRQLGEGALPKMARATKISINSGLTPSEK